MTIIEKQSIRKKKSIMYLVKNGEYSIGYALFKVEELNDAGKFTEEDYEELAEYLESLLEPEQDEIQEEVIEENIE